MKPSTFDYHAPTTLAEALALLDEHADECKVLAGGQSLVPMMNFRLVRPERLIDINRIGELDYIRRRDGVLRIGALTRHAALARSHLVGEGWPLLHAAVDHVAHAQIRNRGTVGGSIVHADAAAELPVALAALDGHVRVRSVRGSRDIPWTELFLTHLTSSLEPDELLVEIVVDAPRPGTGTSFLELSRRSGDYALAGVAVSVTLDPEGTCTHAAIAPLAAGPVPARSPEAEALLIGQPIDERAARAAAGSVRETIAPTGDVHGSADYRRGLCQTLVRRAVLAAAANAKEPSA